MCEHLPAKRFPYWEITGFCVNKYTDSEMRRPVGDRKTQPSASTPFILLLGKKTSRYWTSSGFLNVSGAPRASAMMLAGKGNEASEVGLNVLVTVQRLPSHYSFLTANSSRRVSVTAGLAFILPTPSASSHPSSWLPPALSEARRGLGACSDSAPKRRARKGACERHDQREQNGRNARGGRTQHALCPPSSTVTRREQRRRFSTSRLCRGSGARWPPRGDRLGLGHSIL